MLTIEQDEPWLAIGSSAQQPQTNRGMPKRQLIVPPYVHLGPTLRNPLPVQAPLGSAAVASCLGSPL